MKKIITFCAAVILTSNLAFAVPKTDELKAKIVKYLNVDAQAWLNNKVVIDEVKVQNAANISISEEEMKKLDHQWKEEVKTNKHDLVTKTLNKDASKFLKNVVAESKGLISEIFIMDAKGLDVAKSGITSSMYRGDKPKFKTPFEGAQGTTFIGDIDFDESAQQYLVQGAIAITDENKRNVGVVVVGFNAEKL